MTSCCICGKSLPNKYSVAGKCAEDGCEAVFCALHWNSGNARCRKHGWVDDAQGGRPNPAENSAIAEPKKGATDMPTNEQQDQEPDSAKESRIRAWTKKHISPAQAKSMMHAILVFTGKTGKATGNLVSRLRNGKSPDDMLSEIDASIAENKAKTQPLAQQSESLFKMIALKKKAFEAAPPARRKVLELELRNLLAEYKANERELTTFYDNEHALNVVRGRVLELMAHGMRRIDEDTVDKLTDSIDVAADGAEGLRDSVRDLDKAGVHREHESDVDSFADALAGFDSGETEETQSTDALPTAVETPHQKQQETTRQESPGREPV